MSFYASNSAVARAADRLMLVPVGDVISIRELSLAAGDDLDAKRWIVRAALNSVNAQHGAVFETVRKAGYRRVDHAAGAVLVGLHGIRKSRRVSRRAQKMANNSARFANDMTAEQRRQHNQQMAALGLIEHLSMARTVRTMPDEPQKTDPLAGLRAAIGA